jgi:hypothetical protein
MVIKQNPVRALCTGACLCLEQKIVGHELLKC